MQMENHYEDLERLMDAEPQAARFFDALPDYVQDAIRQRPQGVNSFESLRHYADNLLRGDL